jgi:predicted NAD-dependent protein-ADP-ribosyltransferase YbiA (DUF1768 family)
MRAILKDDCLILIPEGEEEVSSCASWKAARTGHVFLLRPSNRPQLELGALGAMEHACRLPINIVSSSSTPEARLISNLAATPFELDGERYMSVESFWQGLKFDNALDRKRLAAMSGPQARAAGQEKGYLKTVEHCGSEIGVGSFEHWSLMERACTANFDQHGPSREALLSTRERPLEHKVRRDSRAIPGVVMAAIWMQIRKLQEE